MRTFAIFRFWLPPVLGTFVGIVLLFLTGLVREEGPALDLAPMLHYPSNLFMLAWHRIIPLHDIQSVLLVEGTAFIGEWLLIGLVVGWILRGISRDKFIF
jgi:hypothetical protein